MGVLNIIVYQLPIAIIECHPHFVVFYVPSPISNPAAFPASNSSMELLWML
jgi:hypothetical protein